MSHVGIPGVFKMCDTAGLPLEIAIMEIHDRGYVVAWDEFIKDARRHGWAEKTIRRKVLGAVSDAMGEEYAAGFRERFDGAIKFLPPTTS